MTKTTAVAKPEASNLPAPYSPAPMQFDSSDVQLPRIRIAQQLSEVVADGLVENGAIFATTGREDPDPVVLAEPGLESDGFVGYVLGLKKGKSKQVDGELESWDFDDPDAPADAKVTYDYTLAVPAVETDVPFRFLLTGTSTSAAKLMNTTLAKAAGHRPQHTLAFEFKSKPRKNEKFRWHQASIRHIDSTPEGIEVANRLFEQIVMQPSVSYAKSDAPAI